MSVKANLAKLRSLEATMVPDHDAPELSALETVPELLGYLVSVVRSAGGTDEADWVEVFCRHVDMSPAKAREYERPLRALGYRAVADRLKTIAGRRTKTLVPLQ
jgi:hypothetical protein